MKMFVEIFFLPLLKHVNTCIALIGLSFKYVLYLVFTVLHIFFGL